MPRSEKLNISESSRLLHKQRKASASRGNGARKQSRRFSEEASRKTKHDVGMQSSIETSPNVMTLVEDILLQYINGVGLTLFFWCIGGLLLTMYIVVHFNGGWLDRNWELENLKLHDLLRHYWVIMMFFWIGDIVAFWAMARLLFTMYSLDFVTAEQTATYQDMLSGNRDKGSEVGSFTGTTSTSSKDGGVKDSYDVGLRWQFSVPVPDELSLLLRHIFFRGCGGAVVFILITITQVLVCYHLSRLEQGGSLHLLTSTLPVIIVLSIALLRSILMYSVGVPEMLSWLLILVQTIILGVKCTGVFSHVTWFILLLPLLILDALSIIYLVWISGGAIFGRLTISKRQRTCLLIYIMAAMLCMVGQSTLFLMQGGTRTLNWTRLNRKQLSLIGATLCWAGLFLFVVSLYIALRNKARELLTTQCFKDPQPLSCKDNGWGASGGGFEHWWLLGNVEVHSALKRKAARSSGMTGSSIYGTTVTPASVDGKQSINGQASQEMYIQI